MKVISKYILIIFICLCFLYPGCNRADSRQKNGAEASSHSGQALESGAVNQIDEQGRSRLHYAAIQGKPEVVRQAIIQGAEVNKQDNYGFSPLHYASRRNFLNVVEALLEKHASPNLTDHYGCTPLHHAAMKGYGKIVKRLLETGADLNARDRDGCTPAQLAKDEKHFHLVRLLLPLYRRIQEGDLDGTKLLVRKEPGLISLRDPFGRTPLHWAYRFDQNEIIRYLISKGGSKDIKDQFGFSPADYSSHNLSKRTGVLFIDQEIVDRFDWQVYAWLQKYQHVNLGVVLNGKLVLTKVYGQGALNKSYVWGSVSKPVTAMIIHQLQLEGKIKSLDDNIWKYSGRYRNSMPAKYKDNSLTIRHLMLHRSGIPHNNQPTWQKGKLNLKFAPGSDDIYSTPGYGILGHVIEELTGLTFSKAVNKYIGGPAEAPSFGAQKSFRAPGARIFSTIKDMARFAASMINHKYVPANILYNKILQPHSGTYGLGWPLENHDNEDVTIYHGGSNGRPQAYLIIKPRKKLAIVILATAKNPRSFELNQLGRALISELEDLAAANPE